MTHHSFSRRFRHAVVVAAVAASSFVAAAAAPATSASAAQAPTSCANASLVNGSFEEPSIQGSSWRLVNDSLVPGWTTTAGDRRIEIWRAPFQRVPFPDGVQLIELGASRPGTVFQDFATTPGETIRWELQHRGRTGVDTMDVVLGAPGTALAPQERLATGQDWRTYSGFYTVPAGQTTTRLGLAWVSSANGNSSYGNLIDAVSVTSGACVVTSKSVENLSGADSVRLGDTLQYTVVAANQGARDATAASVVDTLPSGLSLVPGSITVTEGTTTTTVTDQAGDDVGDYDSTSRDVRVRVGTGATSTQGGTLAAGASVTVTFSVIVDSVVALPRVDNTATVSYTDALTTTSRESTSNTTTTTITPDAPALSIVTSGTVDPSERQDAAALNDTIVWSYIVTNTGDVPLTDVTVLDPEGGVITCSPTTLAVDESATCTGTAAHIVNEADLAEGSVSNGATAQGTPPFSAPPVDAVESVATIDTAALAPAIEISVSHDNLSATESGSPIVAGDQLRARFVVTNTGNTTLGTVVVDDPTFGAVTCDEVTLAPGESTDCVADELYTVTDTDATAGTISRTVTASGVAAVGSATGSVSDEQPVTLDVAFDLPTLPLPEGELPTLPLPEGELPTLPLTGAELAGPLTLALALLVAGFVVWGSSRLRPVRQGHGAS